MHTLFFLLTAACPREPAIYGRLPTASISPSYLSLSLSLTHAHLHTPHIGARPREPTIYSRLPTASISPSSPLTQPVVQTVYAEHFKGVFPVEYTEDGE